jgi:hypothetical protein
LGVHCQQNLAEQPYCFSGPDGNPRFKKIPLFLKILKLRRSSFFRPQDFRDHLEARSGPRFQKCRFEKFAVSEQVFGTPTEPEQSDGVVLTIAQLGQFLCCKDFLRRFLWYKILRHNIFRVVKNASISQINIFGLKKIRVRRSFVKQSMQSFKVSYFLKQFFCRWPPAVFAVLKKFV